MTVFCRMYQKNWISIEQKHSDLLHWFFPWNSRQLSCTCCCHEFAPLLLFKLCQITDPTRKYTLWFCHLSKCKQHYKQKLRISSIMCNLQSYILLTKRIITQTFFFCARSFASVWPFPWDVEVGDFNKKSFDFVLGSLIVVGSMMEVGEAIRAKKSTTKTIVSTC